MLSANDVLDLSSSFFDVESGSDSDGEDGPAIYVCGGDILYPHSLESGAIPGWIY